MLIRDILGCYFCGLKEEACWVVRDIPPTPPMLESDLVPGFWLELLKLRAPKPFFLELLSASVFGIEALVFISLSPLSG